ncbi:MAG: hypothetical protein RH859_00605 [Longimicrobiales bacterium]
MPRRPFARTGTFLMAAALLSPVAGAGQDPLPMGGTTLGTLGMTGEVAYRVTVDGAGFLTVVARSPGDDLRLRVTDEEGQTLPGGEMDGDHGGDVGAEQAVVVLPRAGTYHVFVGTFGGGSGPFSVGGSFLASDLAARAEDPDGRPSLAQSIEPGADHNDSIDPAAGDPWDWFRITSEAGGILTVLTRAAEGDLRLEIYEEGSYREPLDSSDQDEGGVLGNESISVDLAPGQVIYVRVGPSMGGGGRVDYRLASGLIPG